MEQQSRSNKLEATPPRDAVLFTRLAWWNGADEIGLAIHRATEKWPRRLLHPAPCLPAFAELATESSGGFHPMNSPKIMNKTMSLKQLAANRQNALKSTGPTTPPGRATSKMNALKHGLMSREVLVRGINRRESGRKLEALYQRF